MVQISYDPFDVLIAALRDTGAHESAEKLDFLLHRVSWTTSSELLGALGEEIVRIERTMAERNDRVDALIDSCLEMVRIVWPDFRRHTVD